MELPEKLFNMPIHIKQERKLSGYPPLYSGAYEFYNAIINATPCIIVFPKDSVKPLQISKMFASIQAKEKRWCVLASDRLTAYQRTKLSEYNVAWIASSDTFHVPFLAAASCGFDPVSEKPGMLSANAQFIATHIVAGDWAGITTSELAKLLGKSLSSASNYLAEISAIDASLVSSRGRARFITIPEKIQSRRDAFGTLKPYLKSPVRERRYLILDKEGRKIVDALPHAGITALSEHTVLADDPWTTHAICFKDKAALAQIETHSKRVSRNDEPDALLEIWSYDPCGNNGRINAISLYLSLEDSAHDANDERLEEALDQLREEMLA